MINTDNIKLKFDYSSPMIEDIKRCLSTLYSTREGSQPLDRNFGLNCSFVGKPIPVARNEFALEVVEKTEMYEPRAKVSDITYEYNENDGVMHPTIHLEKGDEYEDE